MRVSIKKNNIIVNFTGLIFILLSLSDIFQSEMILIIGSIISVIIFLFSFPINDKYFYASMTLIGVMFISSIINLLFTDNGVPGSFILLGNLLLSFIYFQIKDKKKLTIWIFASFLITVIFIVYSLFVLKVSTNEIYQNLSRNHAGFVLTFWSVFLLFHLENTYSKVWIIIPLINLVIAFLLIGRTSIIVNFILLLIVYYYKFKGKGAFPFIIAFMIFLGSLYYVVQQYGTILIMDTNLGKGLQTSRWELWREYLKNINLKSFFFGVDLTKLPMIHYYGDNPHNSFLKFHSRLGFGSVVFFSLYFISLINYLRTDNFYIFGLLLILTIRAFFDSDILIGSFDFIFFIITFYWTQLYKKQKT